MHEDERARIFEFMRTMGLRAGATDGHRMTWRHRYRPGRRRPRDLRQYRIAERVCQLSHSTPLLDFEPCVASDSHC